MASASADCLSLMEGLMEYDPDARLSARQALKHPYFRELRDADKRAAKLARQLDEPTVEAPPAGRRASKDAPPIEDITDGMPMQRLVSKGRAHGCGLDHLAKVLKGKLTIGRKHTRKHKAEPGKVALLSGIRRPLTSHHSRT